MTETQLRRFWDWKSLALILLVLLLALVGLVVMLAGPPGYWKRQLLWLAIGCGVCLVVLLFDYKLYTKYAYLFYALILGVLAYTALYANRVSGASSWIDLPFGVKLQPSELAKLVVILVLARVLSARRGHLASLKAMLLPLALVAVPAAFILLQPDLGTALVLTPITLGMLYMAGMPGVDQAFRTSDG